jgi:hypothetical protein
VLNGMRERIAAAAVCAAVRFSIACTHIHTGPEMSGRLFPVDPVYNERFEHLLRPGRRRRHQRPQAGDLADRRGTAPGISFIRRFRMKDGTVRTNPGVHNPDVVSRSHTGRNGAAGAYSARKRPGDRPGQFPVHPDVVSGSLFTADYIGFCPAYARRGAG